MAVLFGTLGWRPQSLIPSIRTTPAIEKLHFYHSDNPKSLQARQKVVEHCNTIGLPVIAVELPDAFNLIDIAKRIKEDIEKVRKEGVKDIRFNIAGGTRLMSSAALLICILRGIPTTYVHDDTFKEIQLPLLSIDYYATSFTSKQKQILEFLRLSAKEPISQTKLAEGLGIHKATMNHHVKKLVGKGAIVVSGDSKDGRARIISLAPHMDLLME